MRESYAQTPNLMQQMNMRAIIVGAAAGLVLLATAGRAQAAGTAPSPQCESGGPDIALGSYVPQAGVQPNDDPIVDEQGKDDAFTTYKLCGTTQRAAAFCMQISAAANPQFVIADDFITQTSQTNYTCVAPANASVDITPTPAPQPAPATTGSTQPVTEPGTTPTDEVATHIENCIDAAKSSPSSFSFSFQGRVARGTITRPDLTQVDGESCQGIVDTQTSVYAIRNANGHLVRNSTSRIFNTLQGGVQRLSFKLLRLPRGCAGGGVRTVTTTHILSGAEAGQTVRTIATARSHC